jgi:hypothetical protein
VQKFLDRQIFTPEMNKNRLREDMRSSIIKYDYLQFFKLIINLIFFRAGYLDSGVSRIVDTVVEQKVNYFQSKVEEILYKYVGIEKPIKEEKQNGTSLEVDNLLPTDLELEQVSSPESDKKEQIEEEICDEDDDFESPAFEPIEQIKQEPEKMENSNLSEISGLTSQDSVENKSIKSEQAVAVSEEQNKNDTALSQISSTQENNTPEITNTAAGSAITLTGISGEEAQMAPDLNDSTTTEHGVNVEIKKECEEPIRQFDLNKDKIEFTGTERKSINLDDSTNSAESEKVLKPQDVQSSMEVENLYENDTTDSSEMRMEIDLKEETSTQETAQSSKIEDSSQDSSKAKEQSKKSEHKREHSRDHHKSSSHKSSRHQHSSSSSKSKHDDKHKSRSSHKKSDKDTEKDRSSSSRRDREKDRKAESSRSKSKHEQKQKPTDDHQQEKASNRKKSTDNDSGDGTMKRNDTQKDVKMEVDTNDDKKQESSKILDAPSTSTKEHKSSILIKYDYLKSPCRLPKRALSMEKPEEEFAGFATDSTVNDNPWFDCMKLLKAKKAPFNKSNDKKSEDAKKTKTKGI